MKKLCFMACLLMAAVSSFAQHKVGAVTIQPKLGINMASMSNFEESDPRFGLVAGAEFEYQASSMVSLTAAALYSQQGLKASDNGLNGTIKMDYLNIPILANVYVVKGLAVKLGLQPGILVNDKVKVSANGVSAEVGIKKALQNAGVTDAKVNSFDLSLPVGVSYETNNIVFDARYNLGLINAISGGGDSTKHQVFQLTVGYKFDLK
ncbi:PorT family protein [Prevotella sp. A2931]|uniref:PorT family protein n=1 Tax=Prevotella illustrans TaxID=2800387 RepID=A0ABS3M5F2_9BACT|nr:MULTISPECIES: porin family protein [Prevotella]MBO1363407.1 PorT family protein [Prevotella illustrans]PTL26112.1 hypothetical protein C3V39_02950 [Prevotella sp. oral taxon 820]